MTREAGHDGDAAVVLDALDHATTELLVPHPIAGPNGDRVGVAQVVERFADRSRARRAGPCPCARA